ncbi:MAG: alpha-L-fucosidase [Verrucomicrobiae bacterium]
MAEKILPALLLSLGLAGGPVEARPVTNDFGITQQGDAQMKWFEDAKFGMFLHWGIYAVPAKGEWLMETAAMTPEHYRKYATDQGDGVYFDAKDYDPAEWAKIAKDSGMKYMCLTARHHDGFALFDSRHTNAFTSVQTIHRDLYAEYVKACRAAGLRVGLYFSPIDWRYPGYYDVWGTNCLPNAWHYQTDSAHKENARVMKEEVYEQVRTLFKNYGPFDYVFWDGGWLGQKGADRDAAFFWEPGQYRDPNNPWLVAGEYGEFDETGRALGLMGIARKYSPNVICNNRSGWIGDFAVDEGSKPVTGPVRSYYWEKCLNLNKSSWGYNERQNLMSYDEIVRNLVDVVVRNGNLLLNFGPDRHGRIPESHAARAREVGAWLKKVGDSIYGTRGGPWNPVDNQYGFTCKPGKYFVHLLPGYAGTEFTTPIITEKVAACRDLFTGKKLKYAVNADGSIHITGLDRTLHPADTVVMMAINAHQ